VIDCKVSLEEIKKFPEQIQKPTRSTLLDLFKDYQIIPVIKYICFLNK